MKRTAEACLVKLAAEQKLVDPLQLAQGEYGREQAEGNRLLIDTRAQCPERGIDVVTLTRRERGERVGYLEPRVRRTHRGADGEQSKVQHHEARLLDGRRTRDECADLLDDCRRGRRGFFRQVERTLVEALARVERRKRQRRSGTRALVGSCPHEDTELAVMRRKERQLDADGKSARGSTPRRRTIAHVRELVAGCE